jgi:hypothetical protein
MQSRGQGGPGGPPEPPALAALPNKMIEEDGPSLVDCRLHGDCIVVLKVSSIPGPDLPAADHNLHARLQVEDPRVLLPARQLALGP